MDQHRVQGNNVVVEYRELPVMNKSLTMGCLASLLLISVEALAAESSVDSVRCANYAKLVTEHQKFSDAGKVIDQNTDPGDVYNVLKACPSQAKLSHAFEVMFEFIDVQDEEDGPKGTGMWDPKATDAEIQQALADLKANSWKTVHGYEQQVKSGKLDESALKATMRYMIWQKTEANSYYGAGLELLARMYPADYPGVKELAKDPREPADPYFYWQQIGDEWLPKTPPAKH
jgi:hypothetical protein